MDELPTEEEVERRRRPVAMMMPGQMVLERNEALRYLDALGRALAEVRRLRQHEC